MSFGNSNRSFGQRPVKRKKQEFHKHKLKPLEEEESNDLSTIKERTMASLIHLGQQRFSQEPGGYSFENWMKSFNLLLDDFEDQIGTQNLPKIYFDKRFELASSLVKSKSTPSVGEIELSKLREEQQQLLKEIANARDRQKIEHELLERKEKFRLLENEKAQTIELLEKAKLDVAQKKKQIEDSTKFLRRFLGTSKSNDQTPLQTLEARMEEIELRLELIEKKILEQRKKIEVYDKESEASSAVDAPLSDLQDRLESVSSSLEELELKQAEKSQLLEERQETTAKMKEVIAGLELPILPTTHS